MYVHLLLNIYAVENDSNKFLMAPFPLQDYEQELFIYTEYSIRFPWGGLGNQPTDIVSQVFFNFLLYFNRIHGNVHYLFIRPLNKYLLNAYHM